MSSIKILFLATSCDFMGDTNLKTGVWLEELAVPYYLFKEAGAELTIASPRGGAVPIAPKSQSIMLANRFTRQFQKDPDAISFLSHSLLLEDVVADAFDVIFFPGGHGGMWDIAGNEKVTKLLKVFFTQNKPIGLLGQGVAALFSLENDDGSFVINGEELTCTSNDEESSAGLTGILPFLSETTLRKLGAIYTKDDNYASHTVISHNIVTGQNASSSGEVAKQVLLLAKKSQDKRIPEPAADSMH